MNGSDRSKGDELGARMEQLASVLERAETTASAKTLEVAREITNAVLDVHTAGLRALLAIVEQEAPEARRALERDPGVLSLLAMHGLNQDALGTRVEAAIATANETLAGQAAAVLEANEGEHVRVRVDAREHAARELMQRTLERLMAERAPEVSLEVTGVGSAWPQAVIPVSRLFGAKGAAGRTT